MSDNGQRVPLPGCMIGPSEPCDAFQRQTARIAELEAELAAERGRREDIGEIGAMSKDGTRIGSLKQVVELRARIAELEAELAAERERREAAEALLHAKGEMLFAVVQGAKEEFVRVPYGASHEDVAAINEWHGMAAEALAAWENEE